MRTLSPAGQQAMQDIAQRHGFSVDAVTSMFDAVVNGNGGMAQFNHPEFAGYGQWMRGGMIMTSDMFNNALKGRIGALCEDLASLFASQPGLVQTGSFQSQSQGSGSFQAQGGFASAGGDSSLFVAVPDWWGPDLRFPTSAGAQNDVRYAYFAQARRLAIEAYGRVTVYDTLDHQIGGFSQQQSGSGTMSFSSQYGQIDVSSLPVVSIDGVAPSAQAVSSFAPAPPAYVEPPPVQNAASAPGGGGDVFSSIEKLAELHARGVLSTDEFQRKKAELLSRL